jgi:hypothetical protein
MFLVAIPSREYACCDDYHAVAMRPCERDHADAKKYRMRWSPAREHKHVHQRRAGLRSEVTTLDGTKGPHGKLGPRIGNSIIVVRKADESNGAMLCV